MFRNSAGDPAVVPPFDLKQIRRVPGNLEAGRWRHAQGPPARMHATWPAAARWRRGASAAPF